MPSRPSIPTRPSLLALLRSGDDVEGWKEFYRIYGDLLRCFALKRGLTESEAEEVVQETAIGVARNLPGYQYVPTACSFKTWMLNLAQWRITDALRRRRPTAIAADPTSDTPLIERVLDPHPPVFGSEWDEAWDRNLRLVALERVRESVDPKHYQIYDLYVLKDRPAREVAARVGVRVTLVYLVKQRVSVRLRKEMRRLEAEAPPPPVSR